MATQVLSFEVDEKTLQTLNELKATLNARDLADVIKMSVTLTKIATANSDNQNVVTLTDGDKKSEKIQLQR